MAKEAYTIEPHDYEPLWATAPRSRERCSHQLLGVFFSAHLCMVPAMAKDLYAPEISEQDREIIATESIVKAGMNFEKGHGTVPETLIWRAARTGVIDFKRSWSSRNRLTDRAWELGLAERWIDKTPLTPEQILLQKETQQKRKSICAAVNEAHSALPNENAKTVIGMRYGLGKFQDRAMEPKQIVASTGMAPITVKNHILRGGATFRKQMLIAMAAEQLALEQAG